MAKVAAADRTRPHLSLFIAGAMAGATISGTQLSADGGGAADWGLRCHRISVRECVVLNREN